MDDEEDLDYIGPRIQRQPTHKRKAGGISQTHPVKTNIRPGMRRPPLGQKNHTPSMGEQFSTAPNSTMRQDSDTATHPTQSSSIQTADNNNGLQRTGSITPISQPPSSHVMSTPSVVSLPSAGFQMDHQSIAGSSNPFSIEELSEDEGQIRVERYARQQFVCTLNNQELEMPVRRAFPGMSPVHPKYKEAINKVRDLYKTWKNRTLTEASNIFEEIIVPEHGDLTKATKIRQLGDILMKNFRPQWLARVLPWANEVVSLVECENRSLRWLKCMLLSDLYLLLVNDAN